MNRMLAVFLVSLLAGCNTFAAPDEERPTADVGVDSGPSNVGTGDAGDLDGGADSGVNDAGGDAGDAGDAGGMVDWTPTSAPLPSYDAMTLPDELETCSTTPTLISSDIPNGYPDVFLLRIATEMERFAVVSVDRDGTLVVTEVDTRGNESVRHRSTFKVKAKGPGKVVSAAAIGDQMLAIALTEAGDLFGVQCEFVTGICREKDLEFPTAQAIELVPIGSRYRFLHGKSDSSLWENEVQVDEEFEVADEETNILVADGAILDLYSGLTTGATPALGMALEINDSVHNYELLTLFSGEWRSEGVIIDPNNNNVPIEAATARPRMVFVSNQNSVWYNATADPGVTNVRNAVRFDPTTWNDGVSWGDGIRDYDFFAIEGGFVELFSNSIGRTKINVNDGRIVDQDDSVSIDGAMLATSAPARVAVAGGIIGIVYRDVNQLLFHTLCDEAR